MPPLRSAAQPPLESALCAGADALGLTLSARQVRQLLDFLVLIAQWNRVYNLTAVRDPADMLTQHLLDSLSVVPPLNRQCGGAALRLLDVGSGAGLPGVVLAIARPDLQVICIDTVAKKSAFVQQVAGRLALPNLQAVHARVEQWRAEPFDLIISRAFASLADFVTLTADHLRPDGFWLAMKGKPPAEEIAGLPPGVEMFHVERLQVPGLNAERCLVWMRHKMQGKTGDNIPS